MGRKKSSNLEYQIKSCVERGETVYVFTSSDKTGITFSRLGKGVSWTEGKWASMCVPGPGARIFIEKWDHYWSGISIYANGKFVSSKTIGSPL